MTAVVVAAVATVAAVAASAGELRVDFIDVGQGDAALVRTPSGRSLLLDAGPPDSARALVALVAERLSGEPLDLAILSHRHLDHQGGFLDVLRTIGARAFMEPPPLRETVAARLLQRRLVERGAEIRAARAGEHIAVDDEVGLTVLAPRDPPFLGTRDDINTNSLVAHLRWRRASVLFTGDAEAPAERWLVGHHREALRARVLKVGHHGSRFSSTERFLRAVAPEIAVISAGAGNDYHHPHPSTLRRLSAIGARVYRTDEHGTITVRSDGEQMTVEVSR